MPGKLILSDEEWKKRLSPEEYEVLRRHGTERPFTGCFLGHEGPRHVRLRRLRQPALPLRREVRVRHRLALVHRARSADAVVEIEDRSYGMRARRCAALAATATSATSSPTARRPTRLALLHELGGDAARPRRRGKPAGEQPARPHARSFSYRATSTAIVVAVPEPDLIRQLRERPRGEARDGRAQRGLPARHGARHHEGEVALGCRRRCARADDDDPLEIEAELRLHDPARGLAGLLALAEQRPRAATSGRAAPGRDSRRSPRRRSRGASRGRSGRRRSGRSRANLARRDRGGAGPSGRASSVPPRHERVARAAGCV